MAYKVILVLSLNQEKLSKTMFVQRLIVYLRPYSSFSSVFLPRTLYSGGRELSLCWREHIRTDSFFFNTPLVSPRTEIIKPPLIFSKEKQNTRQKHIKKLQL